MEPMYVEVKALGTETARTHRDNPYTTSNVGVIGKIEKSPNGETVILRVGEVNEPGTSWSQTQVVRLVEGEVDQLLEELRALRPGAVIPQFLNGGTVMSVHLELRPIMGEVLTEEHGFRGPRHAEILWGVVLVQHPSQATMETYAVWRFAFQEEDGRRKVSAEVGRYTSDYAKAKDDFITRIR